MAKEKIKIEKVKARNGVALAFNQLGKARTQTHQSKKSYTRKRKHKGQAW